VVGGAVGGAVVGGAVVGGAVVGGAVVGGAVVGGAVGRAVVGGAVVVGGTVVGAAVVGGTVVFGAVVVSTAVDSGSSSVLSERGGSSAVVRDAPELAFSPSSSLPARAPTIPARMTRARQAAIGMRNHFVPPLFGARGAAAAIGA